jgi:F420-dependent oxidoreductase-like protein
VAPAPPGTRPVARLPGTTPGSPGMIHDLVTNRADDGREVSVAGRSSAEPTRLGTAVMHMAARAPAATAMAALSMDHLSAGRFVLGLGLSGPDLVRGWYGQPFDPPLGRTRDYLAIVRRVRAADAPVAYAGKHLSLPLPDGSEAVTLTSTVRPLRPGLPIVLGAEGPKNVALAREIADGWIATFYSPYRDSHYRDALALGAARPGARAAGDFEVIGTVPVVLDDDTEAAADRLRPVFASFIGPPDRNFHAQALVRMGHDDVVSKVSALWIAGNQRKQPPRSRPGSWTSSRSSALRARSAKNCPPGGAHCSPRSWSTCRCAHRSWARSPN